MKTIYKVKPINAGPLSKKPKMTPNVTEEFDVNKGEDGWTVLEKYGWESIGGDRNWAEYGHTWAKRLSLADYQRKPASRGRYMVLEWTNVADSSNETHNERPYDYIVSISIVDLDMISKEHWKSIMSFYGDDDMPPPMEGNAEQRQQQAFERVYYVHAYGDSASIDERTFKDTLYPTDDEDDTRWEWDKEPTHDKVAEFLNEMLAVAKVEETFHAFKLDQPSNGFGATGWDMMKGNPFGEHKRSINKARKENGLDEL